MIWLVVDSSTGDAAAGPIWQSADLRGWPTEWVPDEQERLVAMTRCEELVGGRWKPFYSLTNGTPSR
ncbi:MAG TPA: hypothetical protein VI452_12935 [Marmoricola sp.]